MKKRLFLLICLSNLSVTKSIAAYKSSFSSSLLRTYLLVGIITDAIKDYTENKLSRLEKYFKDDDIKANVLARVRGNSQIVEVTIPTSIHNQS